MTGSQCDPFLQYRIETCLRYEYGELHANYTVKCAHNENWALGIRSTRQPWALECFKQDRSLKDRIHLAKPLKVNETSSLSQFVCVPAWRSGITSEVVLIQFVSKKWHWSVEIGLEKLFTRNCGGKLTNSW